MHPKNLGEGKEASMIFSLQRGRTRLVIKEWAEDQVITLRQVHSSEVHFINSPVVNLEGDVLITQRKGLRIGVRTADCVPLALLGEGTVAIIHAGWRGLKEDIVEKTLRKIRELEPLDNFLAFVGPSAKACCYEVGKEFENFFTSLYYRNKSLYMDTQEEALVRLLKGGIKHFYLYKTCTICHDSLPSHRRNKTTERLLTYAEILI
ncbi:MAG: polyphenol oxidase family protein [Aquificaceae bacterium]